MDSYLKEDLTPRERWLNILGHRKPDRVPMDYWATKEVTERLMNHLGCRTLKEMYARLHVDAVISVNPKYVGPCVPRSSFR